MRKKGVVLAALGLGIWWGARKIDKEFHGVAGRVATTVSPKWRRRHRMVLSGAELGRKAATAGAFWAMVPKRRKRVEEEE